MVEQEGRSREVIGVRIKREAEFPEDPKERFNAVFAALGNSEAKCLTLLSLSEGPLTRDALHAKFTEVSSGVWQTNRGSQTEYCYNTLIPIGLVAEADTLYFGATEYITGYRLKPAGQKFGQPIAAHLLAQSATLPYSLLEIFGQTSKGRGESRSVLNRAKILELLSNEEGLTARDIANRLSIHEASVGRHLMGFSKLGLTEGATVTESGRRIVSEIISPIRSVLVGDERLLSQWQSINWQKCAEQGIEKYRQASGHADQRPINEWAFKALKIIQQSPGIRPRDIGTTLGRTPTVLLKVLSDRGDVRKEKEGSSVSYYPTGKV